MQLPAASRRERERDGVRGRRGKSERAREEDIDCYSGDEGGRGGAQTTAWRGVCVCGGWGGGG